MSRFPPSWVCLVAFQLVPQMAEGATKLACVGDSITSNSGWCEALASKLGTEYTTSNFGVSGTTLMKAGDSPYWACNKFAPSHDFAPNLVIIMLGTNDSKAVNWSHQADFVADYQALIESYSLLSSKPQVYACLPPRAGTNSYGISGAVVETEILPMIRQVASNRNVPLIDLYTAFGGSTLDTSLFASSSDLVHPNAKGAQVIADTVYRALSAQSGAAGAGGTSAHTSSSSGGSSAHASTNQGGTSARSNSNQGGTSAPASSSRATSSGGLANSSAKVMVGGSSNRGGATSSSAQDSATTGGTRHASSSAKTQSSTPSSGGNANMTPTSAQVAGNVATPSDAGCSCRTALRQASSSGWWALLSFLVWRRRPSPKCQNQK